MEGKCPLIVKDCIWLLSNPPIEYIIFKVCVFLSKQYRWSLIQEEGCILFLCERFAEWPPHQGRGDGYRKKNIKYKHLKCFYPTANLYFKVLKKSNSSSSLFLAFQTLFVAFFKGLRSVFYSVQFHTGLCKGGLPPGGWGVPDLWVAEMLLGEKMDPIFGSLGTPSRGGG